MKSGIVGIFGRTNAGKSTLLNEIIGQKVAITSPKPKTTVFPIEAVFEDENGQIVFIDTPGLTGNTLSESLDLIIYLVDHTRKRGYEENKVIGIMRQFKNVPKLLVFNKIDLEKPDFTSHYLFLKEETEETLKVSAIDGKHVKHLITTIYKYLPERDKIIDTKDMVTPLVNIDSKTYLAELIREKIFLSMGQEIPYHVRVETNEITERKNGTLYIKARILTDTEQHRKMIIGMGAHKVKEIGFKTRKELELSTEKKVFLDLTVEINK
jgi:GTP-binding protein Era